MTKTIEITLEDAESILMAQTVCGHEEQKGITYSVFDQISKAFPETQFFVDGMRHLSNLPQKVKEELTRRSKMNARFWSERRRY